MDVVLVIAGILCIGLAVGHETLGDVWVLPSVTSEKLPSTPFGPPSLTASMIHASWHIITVFVLALGTFILIVASDGDADVRTLALRVFSVMWLGVTAVAVIPTLRRVRRFGNIVRLPVPIFFVIVAVLLWSASA